MNPIMNGCLQIGFGCRQLAEPITGLALDFNVTRESVAL